MKKYILVVSALSVVLSGCSLVSNVTQKTKDAVVEQEVKSTCTYEKDVCDFLAAQAKSFQREMVIKISNIKNKTTASSASEMRMDGKGNIQMITMDKDKEMSNMVIFNNTTYFKDYTDNKWFKMTNDKESDNSLFDAKGMIEEMKETYSEENLKLVVENLGEEACGNLTCKKYRMSEDGTETGTTLVWVDTKDKLARKMETSLEGTITTMTYSYEPVTIAEPSPVKEFTTPKLPGNAQVPSQEDIQKMIQDAQEMGGED